MFSFRPLAVALIAVVTLAAAPARPDDKKPPEKFPTEAQIMAAKLKHAEALVKVVTAEDFKQIEEHATELHKISRATEFLNAYRIVEYQFQAQVFQHAAQRMATGARERNSDAVLLGYLDLTKTCVACHQTFRGRKRD